MAAFVDDEMLTQIRELAKFATSHAEIAKELGISRQKFAYWLKNIPSVSLAYLSGRAEHTEAAITTLKNLITGYKYYEKTIVYRHGSKTGKPELYETIVHEKYAKPDAGVIFSLLTETLGKQGDKLENILPTVFIGAPPPEL